MDPLLIAVIVAVFTLIVLFSGIPIAFGLSFVSIALLVAFEGFQMLDVFAETFYAGLNSFVLLSIPMFILMGMAVANSPAGKDLYTGLDRWLWRVPGGLVISNIGACSIFAALSGSSPATCAAIGTMGIPEMRKRGYSDQIATGTIAAGGTLGVLIPPSIVLIVYGIATGTSIGRLFLCGLVPGFMLAGMFAIWALIHSYFIDKDSAKALSNRKRPTLKEKLKKIWNIVKVSMKESVMIMFIIAASYLFAFTLSQLYVTQSLAQSMVDISSNKWVVFILINIFLLIAGFFLPPVAVIVMTSAILLPVITTLGFDPYWFAIVFTINMEIGLITPPVGLNLYIIKGITPDVSLSEILKGSIPFMIIMALAILILCIFPEIVTWLPDKIMGKPLGY